MILLGLLLATGAGGAFAASIVTRFLEPLRFWAAFRVVARGLVVTTDFFDPPPVVRGLLARGLGATAFFLEPPPTLASGCLVSTWPGSQRSRR